MNDTIMIWGYLSGINGLAFLLYGLDKWKAKKNRWRIPEKTLLGIALLGGSLGAFAGMKLFHHKTRHRRFQICIPLFLILHLLILMYL